jgi:4Fe-4S ferredoxin
MPRRMPGSTVPAAAAPDECKQPAGAFRPVIDRSRCEGKDECVRVCPYEVFEVRTLLGSERGALPLMARLKTRFHGNRQAFAVRADSCHACGLCVAACPEKAITLARFASPT